MNNEEKARAIISEDYKKENCLQCGGRYSAEKGGCAEYQKIMQMAQWKDEQFIEFLEWIDNVYVLRRFSDGESINFKGLVEKFKLMQK